MSRKQGKMSYKMVIWQIDSDHATAVDINGGAGLSTTLESFGQHKFSHPIDSLVTTVDSKVVRLAAVQEEGFAVNG